MHGPMIVAVPLWLSAAVAHVWLLMFAALFLRARHIGNSHAGQGWKRALALLLAVVVLYVPYAFWKTALIVTVGPGPHAARFLAHAAASGESRIVERLLQTGVDVNSANGMDNSALNAAAAAGDLQMVQLLVGKGARSELRSGGLGRTALMNAAEVGRADIVAFLLAAGSDPGLTDEKVETALMIARRHGQTEVARILERASAARPK